MKQKLIAAAIAHAITAVSAFAVTPEQIQTGTFSAVHNLAIDETYAVVPGGFDSLFLLDVSPYCQSDSIDVYTVGTGTSRVTAYTCVDGNFIEIFHVNNANSSDGIAAVRDMIPMRYIDPLRMVNDPNGNSGASQIPNLRAHCTPSYRTGSGTEVSRFTYTMWTCDAGTITKTAVPGSVLSDVEPIFLGQSDTAKDGSTIRLSYSLQKTFGVAVTIALRNALQQAQGLPVGSDLAKDTPSLSPAIVGGVFNRRLKTAADMGVANDTTPIYPLRLSNDSTTEKIAEAYFFSQGVLSQQFGGNVFLPPSANYNSIAASDATCGTATAAPSAAPAPTATPIYAGATEEDVVNCLNRHNAGHRYAIANLSMLFNAFANPASNSWDIDLAIPTGFRYVKLNGYLPTVENVVRGNYEFFAEGGIWGNYMSNYGNDYAGLSWFSDSVNDKLTQWTDLPEGVQTSGFVRPAVASACKGTFTSLGTTPDIDPVNFATKNPTGSKINNAVKAIQVCPPRF